MVKCLAQSSISGEKSGKHQRLTKLVLGTEWVILHNQEHQLISLIPLRQSHAQYPSTLKISLFRPKFTPST